ncbi:MAG: aminopeptidase P family N-terminal domain-containing protein [Devosia sp.]|uniref:M24 family metallopeptidase n=1 Tax=Devosia sp. TaxID=1871048 RepID=UPI001ACF0231|nr:aminopeptidase P family N-terminal domain-containing protein [Devosia sp.]MBN9317944.1 aminopeptidase P family N-terminal domain-containing protein [Devosia sp.]
MPAFKLIDAKLPDFGVPKTRPELDRSVHVARFNALNRARRAAGLDVLVVYADREHAANLAYLTGFDPRFEEALLVIAPDATPTLLTGPENLGRANAAAIEVEARLYPPFGLMGQDRTKTPALDEVLGNAGIAANQRIGVLGWKYFGPSEASKPESWLETPSYIIDTLRQIAGPEGRVVNANALLMHPVTGLRAVNEIVQIAQFEFGAVACSEAVKALIGSVRPGMSGFEAVQNMRLGVLPHSCHTMFSSGDELVGLNSPTGRVLEKGDPMTTAVGYWGGLSSRMGWLAEDAGDLPDDARDYVERLAGPYFACAAEWYETIGIGVTGGELDALARRHLDTPFFKLVLNPGHLIHIDEWMNTQVYPGSTEPFLSGQCVQVDIIPAAGPPYYGANIEDGIALLDARGRDELRASFPDVWNRIEARRAFMGDVLGIRLKPEVLPLSNLAGAMPPFWLAPERIVSRA